MLDVLIVTGRIQTNFYTPVRTQGARNMNSHRLVFLFLIACLHMRSAMTKIDNVNRLNHGMMFFHKHTILPVTHMWRHNFVINLPVLDLNDATTNTHKPEYNVNKECEKFDYFECVDYAANVLLLHEMSTTGLKYIKDQLIAIYDILPMYVVERETDIAKRQSPLGWFGGLFAKVFDLVSVDDIKILKKAVQEIAENQNKDTNVIKTSYQDLHSFVQSSSIEWS